jgi:hypothetical protein
VLVQIIDENKLDANRTCNVDESGISPDVSPTLIFKDELVRVHSTPFLLST